MMFNKLGRKGSLLLQQMQAFMWIFFIFFLILAAFLVVYSISLHTSRTVENDNIETFLAKEYLVNNFVENGEINSSNIQKFDTLFIKTNYAIGVGYGGDIIPLNKFLYDEKSFCKFKQYDCGEYSDVFLVDGELKEVEFEVVWKNA